jgi:hypothetical protein
MRYAGGEVSGLELVLSPNVGALEGDTEPRALVVLIPMRGRDARNCFVRLRRTAQVYAIPDITPQFRYGICCRRELLYKDRYNTDGAGHSESTKHF